MEDEFAKIKTHLKTMELDVNEEKMGKFGNDIAQFECFNKVFGPGHGALRKILAWTSLKATENANIFSPSLKKK